jgi:hypothetical protein
MLFRVSVEVDMLYGRNRLIPANQTYTARYPNVQVSLRLSDEIVN